MTIVKKLNYKNTFYIVLLIINKFIKYLYIILFIKKIHINYY